FATRTVPEGAATTTMLLLLFALGVVRPLHAQHVEGAVTVAIVPKTPVERELQSHLVCMCGTCGRKRIGECTCPDAGAMQQELHQLVEAGKTYDEIVQHFVQKYGGQHVLAAPINTGFNRMAWLLPYAAGGLGIVVIGAMAVRWTRRGEDAAPDTPLTAGTPDLENRLDDELRDLD
ncbi:MAG TPA: cytochrome c-type biogenesis protein CcmH, partial [Vicinamibacterales bacterium]|nr:cytochrome c-type biogenesis protein CcmH [Vicinamibacterales bacterium]